MADVLLVSKPLAPPWTDGAVNLVRDLVTHASGRHRLRCMVPRGAPPPAPGVIAEPVYSAAGSWRPGRKQSLEVLRRLVRPDRADIYHFFFAPNPRTNRVARAVLRAKRRRRVIHTVASRPNGVVRTWFAEVHVALSEATAELLRSMGAPGVRLIRPGIARDGGVTPDRAEVRREHGLPPKAPLVLFPGDMVKGGGGDLLAEALLRLRHPLGVYAHRPKGPDHAAHTARLQARLGRRAHWVGVVRDLPRLMSACDVVCLPATDLLAKMDVPLVLLEALRAGVPVMVADVPPLDELGGEAGGVVRVPPEAGDLAQALDALLNDTARREALAQAGRQAAGERWDVAHMSAAYEALYDELEQDGGRLAR